MCGILGVVRRGRPIERELLARARDLLRHRGPDAAGAWDGVAADGITHVTFGHRRLSILDLSERGAQPLYLDHDGRAGVAAEWDERQPALLLVYNGEIYNYIELRDELKHLGQQFWSACDTEVLLRAYAVWGPDCLARLNGMFAFAIWDQRRGELFCARDRFGEKPLYFVWDADAEVFGFASEVKALVGAGLADASLDERALYRYLRFGEQAGVSQTIWRGVRRLPPAHALTLRVDPSGSLTLRERAYWEPPPHEDLTMSADQAAEEFGALFRDSVRLRLRSDVPIGTSLSGGLDSSSVLCTVRSLGALAGQKAFTARMTGEPFDEGHYVDRLLAEVGIPGFGVEPTASAFLAELDRLCYHQEEPYPTTSVFASYLVHQLARSHGVTVMLDGQGADEFLAGYASYPTLVLVDAARRGDVARWWSERRALRARTGADPVPPAALLHHWRAARADGPWALVVDHPNWDIPLAPDFATQFREERPREVTVEGDALRARLRADLMQGHLQELLRYADRNSMAHSVEVRLPFLDHRLVELTFRLPTRQVLSGAESKRILRRAMRGVVPDFILRRSDKIGFETPWRRWWQGPQRDELRARSEGAVGDLHEYLAPVTGGDPSTTTFSAIALASARHQLRALRPHSAAFALR